MLDSLRDIQLIHGFKSVEVEYFRQLPSTWAKNNFPAFILAEFSRLLVPPKLKKHSKWIRFSKEIMLLSSAKKSGHEL